MPKGYHHLTYTQRCQIYILKDRGDFPSSIARALDVHASTIGREVCYIKSYVIKAKNITSMVKELLEEVAFQIVLILIKGPLLLRKRLA
jgi:IS30 family transposase